MKAFRWTVERAGFTVVQDLGRPGHAWLGVAVNGASDHRSARTANALVGNADDAPLLEVTASDLVVRTEADCLVAVTGAVVDVAVDSCAAPVHQPLVLRAGSSLTVPSPATGLRSYVAVNGGIEGERHLGSVAPDPLLGVGHRLAAGDEVRVRTAYLRSEHRQHLPLYRFGTTPPAVGARHRVAVLPGLDLARMAEPDQLLDTLVVQPQSDHVGLRLDRPDGGPIAQHDAAPILSRGVPVGAVELPGTGGFIVLLRGRLLTAGYPVVAVVGSAHLDQLGQARPGDELLLSLTDADSERAAVRRWEDAHHRIAERVRRAFATTGIGHLVDPAHGQPARTTPEELTT